MRTSPAVARAYAEELRGIADRLDEAVDRVARAANDLVWVGEARDEFEARLGLLVRYAPGLADAMRLSATIAEDHAEHNEYHLARLPPPDFGSLRGFGG